MRINHIGLSGGKDSTALWGWAINESGYPKESIRGSFCDTENEYQDVYDQIKILDEYGQDRGVAPVRVLRANNPQWTWTNLPLFLALAMWKKRFPSARARFCTTELKIIPSQKYIEELQLNGHEVVAHSGVRANESIERSLMQEWDRGQFNCMVRRPLLKWTISDVWAAHQRYGLRINPLYFKGRKRVGCKLCCMSTKRDVRVTANQNPETIDTYETWEGLVGSPAPSAHGKRLGHGSGFFHAQMVPERFRSIKGLIRKKDSSDGRYKKGDTYSACTIRDVVRWSMTGKGAKEIDTKQMAFELNIEQDFNQDDMHAPCSSGYCE